jgi:pyruvate dehydrogenase E2 component (dihydrolipoamide acetyltransferase)
MATELVMPRLSDTMDTGTIGKWLKKVGDEIKEGDIIAEIETDKANMEMESFSSGVLARIIVDEGQSTGVGEPIGVVAADAAEAQKIQSEGPAPAQAAGPSSAAEAPSQPPPEQGPPAKPQVGDTEPTERVKASPIARRIAQEHNISLLDVAGTGPGGRITKEDVQSFLKQAAPVGQELARPAPAAQPQTQPAQPAPQPAGAAALRGAQPVEMTRMQQTIARRMVESRFTKPEFVLTTVVDMTEAQALIRSLRGMEGAPRIGPNDFLMKTVAVALRQHPELNAGWENDGIVRYDRVNIGNAVAIEGGLVVPVIKDADRMSLGEISRESKGLIEKARNNKLAPSEYEGGTFTISNLGMFGIEMFTPIINAPEACIMGVGSITPTPVVRDDDITVRSLMHVTLSCDHRVINGAQGAEFLQTLKRLLESPMLAVL